MRVREEILIVVPRDEVVLQHRGEREQSHDRHDERGESPSPVIDRSLRD
jgi:hypothetical protein